MGFFDKLKSFFSQLSNIPVADPDDSRRRRLLNIILFGTAIVTFILVIAAIVITSVGIVTSDDGFRIALTAIITFIATVIIFIVNRYISGRYASILFLLFLMVTIGLSDDPPQLVNGRSTYVFVIPIIISSVLLTPSASFLFYALCSIEMGLISQVAGIPPNTPAISVYSLLALISWLSSRSLEQALREVRLINTELDQRVADRTAELSEALSREHNEASRRQAILQGIADGVLVLNMNGDAIMANPAISRLLDIPLDKLVRHNLSDILASPNLSEEDRNILIHTIGASDATMAPMRIRWDKKTLSVRAAPVRDANGQAIGNVAVLRDFTREAEVEEMKNTFVAMVSHELRTPLNAILGYSEMLRDAIYGPVNEKQTNAADRILKNSRRLLDIVSDLLDKAQIEAGHLTLSYEEFRPVDMIENLHGVMDKIAHDRGLELTSSIAPDMPQKLESDPQRIQQILVNLVNNAVKFTEKGGIDVHVYRVTDEHWAFDVKDTGPGIALEDQKYIFDPFRQLEGTTTRSHGGIGLGLAIVKRIVDLMGGRIFVQSTVGQGTTFTVILPFEPLQFQKKE